MTRSTRAAGLACAAVAALGLAACGGSGGGGTSSTPPPPPTSTAAPTTPTPTPTQTPKPKPPPVDPLTGGKLVRGPAYAVKIDDTANGRPQVAVNQADIVYVEQVEGGLTRLAAVFHSRVPKWVGPVRSVRSSDPELLSQFGAIAFVASGGAHDALPALDKSVLKADINDRGGPGFSRAHNRPAPYNLMVRLAKVPHGANAKSIGWTWSASTKQLAGTAKVYSIQTVVGSTPVRFQWHAKLHRYVRVIGGASQHSASGALISTPNVIVQFCKGHVNKKDVDVAGNPNYFTETVGKGKVAVFRNGHRVNGTWSRPKTASGTTLTGKNGKPIALAPGGAWVVLVHTNAPLN